MSNAKTLLVVLIYAAITLPGTAQADTGSAVEAHDAFLAALAAGDADAIEQTVTDDGEIAFSLGEHRVHLGLREWLGHFRQMIASGTRLSIVDREVSGGGGEDTAWFFAVQDLAWTPAGASEPASSAVWYTTEVWEHDGERWKVAHVHHGLAPDGDNDE